MSNLDFNIRDLLGLCPSSESLSQYINSLASIVPTPDAAIPQVKSYPDAVYLNFFSLGLSLLFTPLSGYKPSSGLKFSELDNDNLALDSIDFYNIPGRASFDPMAQQMSTRKAELAFSVYPISPLVLTTLAEIGSGDINSLRPSHLDVLPATSGKDFLQCLGEPDRKGGGAGPSSGSIGIWCEWSVDGIMVEFGGNEAKGPQAWERGKDAIWKVVTVFRPSKRAK
ncbi:hypothetical protein BDZ94DRAFT_1166300 [Collybia nuda]|uniref:Uncharacterized protein n=1 Tax=Collybia nuda TaxID=64659 RepID=A0A9P6CDT3_9AGAR|nr:hypothetical protein BDZ94DRAFT_1166300 [Collybia nuda]